MLTSAPSVTALFPSLRLSASEAALAPTPEAIIGTPHGPDDHGGPDDTLAPGRDLVPDHGFLAKEKIHTPVPAFTPDEWKNARHYDVVVVGGGMSGLHTAWRLRGLDGSPPPAGRAGVPSVAIFERTHHTGGRVRTFRIKGDEPPVNLGAMRFIPSQHKLVNGLAQHFGIASRDFTVGGAENLQHFRGIRLTNAQVAADPSVLPFHLTGDEKGKTVEQLLVKAISDVVPDFDKLTAEQWDAVKRTTTLPYTDPSTRQSVQVPLHQLGLHDVLERTLSHEALEMVTSSLGYPNFLANWDAGEILNALSNDFKPGTEYKTPVDGMAAFPRALVKSLKADGVPIEREQTLRQVSYDKSARQFHLVFEDGRGNATPIVCEQAVLAMPKAPLAAVTADSPFLQGTRLEQTLDKVTANPMTRIFITYDKPWWNEQGIVGGRSVTDMPLDQVYYCGDAKDARPYVQVYADGRNSAFFAGLQNPATPGVDTSMTATPQLAAELQREMNALHGRELPAPTGFLYKRWSDEFFGGAYHTWNLGAKPFEASEAMIAPLPDMPLYVCGEAFSTSQGWIEGALQTSEKVLANMGKDPSKLQ